MIEVHELLDRTTPTELPPLDIDRLQRRARGRRHRRVAALGAAAVLIVAVAAAAVGVAQRDPKSELAVVPVPDVPGAFTDKDPASGRWAQAAPAPFSPRGDPFTGTTSDGRVLVWGGADGTGRKTDGGIYDPVDDSWEPIPPAPLSGEVAVDWSALSRDRLVVMGASEDGTMPGAMFDLRTGAWTTLPSPPSMHGNVDGYAWNGEVLVLIRTGADPDDPDLASPVVERWSIEDGWKEGAASPLSTRYSASISSDGDRLAVWGGTTGQLDFDDPPTADLDQGAIYDVDEDRWTAMAPGPLSPRVMTTTSWVDGQVVIAGGRPVWSGTEMLASGAVYDPGTGRWDELPPFPDGYMLGAFFVTPPKGIRDFDDGLRQTLLTTGFLDGTTTTLTLDLGTGTWHRGPLHNVHPIAGTYIDTNVATATPSNEPFAAQVLVAGTWRPVSDAPFGNRAQPGIVVSGERMVVVGGYTDPAGEPTAETWVLDLS